ncbi:MAG TPA: PA14 domain-containing protein, partial [Verrucomicrobiae bacterium]|nr:PA14 domain-containing protein [Verrucomicrobiae bacterium]
DLTSAPKYPNAPDHVWYATAFDSRTVYRDDTLTNRGVRLSGFITPSESGDYEFMLRSDDAGQLFLSPDNNVANLALIAEETTCCGPFEEPGAPETSAIKTLTAGQSYAIRALYKQGGGANFCQVAWRKVGDTNVAANLTPISGSFLSTMIPAAGTVSITQQPAAVTAAAAGSATFKVQFTTSHAPIIVLWQKDGITLPGRLGDTLTLSPLTAADAGAYRAIVSIPGATAASSTANLTVTPDVTPPRILKATVGDSLAIVSVEFSERMDPGGLADSFSYVLTDSSGGLLTVFGGIPLGPTKVRLSTDPLTLGATYNLSLVDIRDLAGNLPETGNTFPFPTPNRVSGGVKFEAYLNLAGTDPGVIRADPRYPDSPDIAAFVTQFTSRQVFADAQSRDNYGGRLYGWIVPQETAQYEFFIRSDDASNLYLSPDEHSAHAVVIAGETGCCGPFEDPGAPETSAPMSLTANQPYYIEALWKEGGGGDYCDVAWRKVGDSTPARTLPFIAGSVLAADAPPATFAAPTVAFTSPSAGSVVGTNVPLTLTLSATAAAPKSIVKIELLEQGRVVGQINESPFSITFYELRQDSHTFIARATDSAGQTTDTPPLTVSIGGVIQRVTLLAINDVTTWRYDRSAQDLGTAWSEAGFDDSSWPSGPTLIADESTTTVEPIRTAISRFNDQGTYVKTFYFRTRFNFSGASTPGIKLALRHVIDDGAVFYLNGTEIHRFGIAAGPVTAATDATGHENVYEGPYDIPVTALVEGENVLAAELHQAGASSSDMVFGAELTAAVP